MFYCTIRWGAFFAARFGADMQWPVGEFTLEPNLEEILQSCKLYSFFGDLDQSMSWKVISKSLPNNKVFLMTIHISTYPTPRNGFFLRPWFGNRDYICTCICIWVCICISVCICVCIWVCVLAGGCIRITLSSGGVWAHARLQRNRSQSIQRLLLASQSRPRNNHVLQPRP